MNNKALTYCIASNFRALQIKLICATFFPSFAAANSSVVEVELSSWILDERSLLESPKKGGFREIYGKHQISLTLQLR